MSLALRAVVVSLLLTFVSVSMPALASTHGYGHGDGDQTGQPITPLSKSSSSSVPAGMRILVRFRPTASDAEVADAVHSVNGWIDATIPALGVTRIALPGGSDDAVGDGPAVAAFLATQPAVESAEYDAIVRLSFTPTDPLYADDPYVHLGQWGIRKALVDQAWDKVRGSSSVTVATLDTGVDASHLDLQGALVAGTALVSQPSSGCDPSARNDDNSHGTHVAGIIGAAANNGAGIAGVAFGAKVMPVKVLDCTGVGSLSDVADGLVWAVDHGAKIVNVSLGSPFDGSTLRSAVTYAVGHNVLVVSAAGNCGTLTDRCSSLNQLDYPAAYPEVLAVGATDTDDSVAFFSSRNSSVDVAAPGRRIVSTTPTYVTYLSSHANATLNYAAFSGTSQAAPFVSGLAALVWSGEPTLTAQQVFQRLEQTADDLGPAGRDDGYGFGRVNALRAVTTANSTADRYGAGYDMSAVPKSVTAGKAFIARVGVTNLSSFAWGAADTTLDWTWLDASGAPAAGLAGKIPLASDVAPAASITWATSITAPATAGTYTLRFDLDRAGVLFSTKGVAVAALTETVGSGFGATYTPATAGAASFDLGATVPFGVTLVNTGSVSWPASGPTPVHLSYHWLQNGAVVQWDGLRANLPNDVATGGKVTVSVPVMPPDRPGTYTLRLDLVQEGVSWFTGLGVAAQDLNANVRSAFVATYAPPTVVPALLPGGRTQVAIQVTNAGTIAWSAGGPNPVHVAAHVSDRNGNVVIWDGARTELKADVTPGAQISAQVVVDAPAAAGPYRVRIDLVREGIAWFSSLGVPTADVDLLVAADTRASFAGAGPLTVSRANPTASVTIKNTSLATWTTTGAAPVNVAVHWLDAAGNVLVWDGPRTALPGPVAPDQSVTLSVQLGPPPAGAGFVVIDLVSEGIAWFGQGPLRQVTLTP